MSVAMEIALLRRHHVCCHAISSCSSMSHGRVTSVCVC